MNCILYRMILTMLVQFQVCVEDTKYKCKKMYFNVGHIKPITYVLMSFSPTIQAVTLEHWLYLFQKGVSEHLIKEFVEIELQTEKKNKNKENITEYNSAVYDFNW